MTGVYLSERDVGNFDFLIASSEKVSFLLAVVVMIEHEDYSHLVVAQITLSWTRVALAKVQLNVAHGPKSDLIFESIETGGDHILLIEVYTAD